MALATLELRPPRSPGRGSRASPAPRPVRRASALGEHQLPAGGVDLHRVAVAELAGEDLLRQRVLDLRQDRALERARAIDRVEAHVPQQFKGLFGQLQLQPALGQALLQPAQLDPRDLLDLVLVQRVEHDDVVQAVDEFRAEMRLDHAHHRGLHLRVGLRAAVGRQLLDLLRAQVGGHHDHGVAEVDRAPLAVGQAAVVQHLQQDVEHVRVRLLDLVEQDQRVRPAAHRLGQVAALLVTDVAGRRADQPGHGVLLHELAHVDAHPRVGRVEQELGQRLAQLGLADAGRAQEQERADRAVRVRQAGARTPHRIGDHADRLLLADHALAHPRSKNSFSFSVFL